MVSTRTNNKLRKKDADSGSDSDDEEYIEYEVESDSCDGDDDCCDEETDDNSENDEELLRTKQRKNGRKKIKQKRRVYADDCDDDGDDYDEEDELSEGEVRREIAKLFPSNYINSKVKKDEGNKKKKELKKKAFEKMSKKTKQKRNMKKESKSLKHESETDHSDSDSGSDESYVDGEEEEDEDLGDKVTMVFDIFGTGINGMVGGVDQDEEALQENDDCDSDDEKMFLKENYEKIELPDEIQKEDEAKKKAKNDKKKSTRKKLDQDKNASDNEDMNDISKSFEIEYVELLEMRKMFAARLKERPNSAFLKKALYQCRKDMKQLIKKTRGLNAKHYYKLMNSQKDQFTSEIAYFKKKLSNKEQLKVMKDMKEINDHIQVDKPYRLALLQSEIPIKYKASVMQKVNMLKSMEPGDPEYYKVKNWVDDFMQVPFGKYSELNVNLDHGIEACNQFMADAMKILDDCAYGLNDAKMQILQMVGQWISNPNAMGTAIALKGPMGTGKTTLVKDGISKILQRYFAFIPLGGCGDGSYLEGHGYAYEGSKHGKIVQVLKDAGNMSPCFYFDELDKVSDTPRGEEIIGILTHLTDTSQNNEFHDKYFSDVDFDLSKSLFIFSYNDESRVNPILKDRMYCIQTTGYNTKEKLIIARDYLLPKIREQVNFNNEDVIIPDSTIEYIITNKSLTKEEDGVRNLKRCLEVIHTKVNLFRLVKMEKDSIFSKEIKMDIKFPFTVSKEDVDKLIKSEPPQNQSVLSSMYV